MKGAWWGGGDVATSQGMQCAQNCRKATPGGERGAPKPHLAHMLPESVDAGFEGPTWLGPCKGLHDAERVMAPTCARKDRGGVLPFTSEEPEQSTAALLLQWHTLPKVLRPRMGRPWRYPTRSNQQPRSFHAGTQRTRGTPTSAAAHNDDIVTGHNPSMHQRPDGRNRVTPARRAALSHAQSLHI